MSNRKKPRGGKGPGPAAGTPAGISASDSGVSVARSQPARRWIAVAAFAALVVAAIAFLLTRDPQPASTHVAQSSTAPVAAASYVGGQACAACHAAEYKAWKGSHHDLAMQIADENTVLGNFNDAKFRYAGITSTFFRRNGKYYINTDGPDGKLADFEIKYTFGLTPLQQYLIELPGGRLQAFSVAWDSRPQEQGGQRWFHLYPDRKLKAGDPQHWTGIDQNWNYQCADCHSTNLRKHYHADTKQFETKWSEINVSCEACHGPGSNHIAWAKEGGDWRRFGGPGKGLTVLLDERRGATWTMDPATGNAARSQPRQGVREIETCARCHARRGQFTDDVVHGRPFADSFRLALLDDGLYWPDGQQRDEVYNHGSFLQSRMFEQGVTCSDCHEPHSLKLRAPGNAVCAQCHAPADFDTPAHHHHPVGSKGAECAACHMPTETYMVIDPRHDHSMRIPRPDLSVKLGTPNACNKCHADKKPQWAAQAVRTWFPNPRPGHQTFAKALAASTSGASGAMDKLIMIVEDKGQPAIARASALARLGPRLGPAGVDVATKALNDDDALVRSAAVDALSGADPALRRQLLPRMLDDPVRRVRMDAARALASVLQAGLNDSQQAAFAKALDEYVAAQRFNADRPESRLNLGALYAERDEFDKALAEYRAAIELDPTFVQVYVNLADLYRMRGLESEAEATLRDGLKRDPKSAALHHALGLTLVRQKRTAEAITELREAAKLAPDDARLGYVYAVALDSTGQKQQALKVLEALVRRHPDDRDVLMALVTFNRNAGATLPALDYARRLAELEPENPQVRRLVAELGG
jgi:predicted CXXCH cytochrome family protein